ncbi:hypothetical protein DL93DRAFT_767208 [Clavulina sp. PMI_390]|nr:hypothetical protein DL93DRAFT_767208 [Clavulina sp. PMI_390]
MGYLDPPSPEASNTTYDASEGRMMTLPTTLSPISSLKDHTHPREVYLDDQRRKHQLHQISGPVTLHPRTTAFEGQRADVLEYRLNPSGDILAILLPKEIVVFDFHQNQRYTVRTQNFGYNGPSPYFSDHRYPFSVERFRYNTEGALLVVMQNWRDVYLIFQPFGSQNYNALLLGSIPVNRNNRFLWFHISGVYLIMGERSSALGVLRVYNLVDGQVKEFDTNQARQCFVSDIN